MNKKSVVVIVAVLALAAGFGGGYFFRNYQLSKIRANFGANGNVQRFMGNRNGQNGVGMMGRGGVISSIAPATIEPGSQEVTVNVTVTYEIE